MQPRHKRFLTLAALGGGVAVALYLGSRTPRTQHVRLALGAEASEVTGVEILYVAPDGDVVRTSRFRFDPGAAPRVLVHDPELVDGAYLLRIEVDARTGRRTVERRVTLGGGSTHVDLEPRTRP